MREKTKTSAGEGSMDNSKRTGRTPVNKGEWKMSEHDDQETKEPYCDPARLGIEYQTSGGKHWVGDGLPFDRTSPDHYRKRLVPEGRVVTDGTRKRAANQPQKKKNWSKKAHGRMMQAGGTPHPVGNSGEEKARGDISLQTTRKKFP